MAPDERRLRIGSVVARIPSQCGQRRGERGEVLVVALDGDHTAGAVVCGEDQRSRRTGYGPIVRTPLTRPRTTEDDLRHRREVLAAEPGDHRGGQRLAGGRRRGERYPRTGGIPQRKVEILRHELGHESGPPPFDAGLSGTTPATGRRVRTATQSPVECTSTSWNLARSTPDLTASAVASAVASICAA